jgi:hypothetical protein
MPLSWTCTCRIPPLVLATFDLNGNIHLEHKDRYWKVNDRITTNCPGCGKQHRLELMLRPEILENLPEAWKPGDH